MGGVVIMVAPGAGFGPGAVAAWNGDGEAGGGVVIIVIQGGDEPR